MFADDVGGEKGGCDGAVEAAEDCGWRGGGSNLEPVDPSIEGGPVEGGG